MNKLNIAIIFGGCSSEYGVSLESASAVIRNLDESKYKPVLIGISNEGDWFYYTGPVDKIQNDTWKNSKDCVSAVISPNRRTHELLLLGKEVPASIKFDAVLPILHGKNGEDGTVQGLISLSGIPLVGCNVLASSLCMDKDRAHKLAGLAGVRVPKAMVILSAAEIEEAKLFARKVGFPLFVKPVKAGSSYGVSKVQSKDSLQKAIEAAFHYDTEVIIEENIDGFEVGCAVLGTNELITGEVDEIELSGGFFNFTEKYTLKTSAIHVPARISKEKSSEVKETAKRIYKALGCSGFARVDMFLTTSGEIVFNEVNTIPGFTEHSRYPGMMKAAGYSFQILLDKIIEQAVKK
ncbi:D-alanine--D-serine ligase VanG [Anaerosacchariphilus polymeriproducens]|uniref:D-alanine--D-alanine ligase n=1 Tax=Anaerosacchariphilus polymeriproducens TaxID=1812858 RepID=A0A371AZW6_9FIRM|nr:D-alanine--D-serine ligase VanG [Anaerosacchariphilus polymeriproducens]RDU25030.1 D-alanine--D-serine ligase VanG [Anaerosacchariphilus polymeriproducens]